VRPLSSTGGGRTSYVYPGVEASLPPQYKRIKLRESYADSVREAIYRTAKCLKTIAL